MVVFNNQLFKGKKKPWFITFVDFYDIKIPAMADSMASSMQSSKEMLTIDSCEQV